MGLVGRRAARGSFVLAVRDLLYALIGFIGSVVIARALGPSDYGLVSIALMYPTMAAGLADLSLSTAAVRFAAAPGQREEYAYTALALKALLGLAAGASTAALAPLLADSLGRPHLAPAIAVLGAYVFAESVLYAVASSLTGLGLYEDTALVYLLRNGLRVAASVALVLAGAGWFGAVLGFSIGCSAALAAGLAVMLRRIRPARPSPAKARELLAYSLPLWAPGLASIPLGFLVLIVLATRASDAEMGELRAAGNLTAPIGVVAGAVGGAVFSSLPLLLGGDGHKLKAAASKSLAHSTIVVAPTALGVAILAEPLTRLVYGDAYPSAPAYLALLALQSLYVAAGAGAVQAYANVVGDTKFNMRLSLAATALGAPVSTALILWWGIWGYLAAPFITNGAAAYITIKAGERRHGLRLGLREPALALAWAAASAAASYPLSLLSPWAPLPAYLAALALLAPKFIPKERLSELREYAKELPLVGPLAAKAIGVEMRLYG